MFDIDKCLGDGVSERSESWVRSDLRWNKSILAKYQQDPDGLMDAYRGIGVILMAPAAAVPQVS
jgi:hypothetical protein